MFRLFTKDIGGYDSKGLGMYIEWGVFENEFYKEIKKYRWLAFLRDEKVRTGAGFNCGRSLEYEVNNGSVTEIDYTEEREVWFRNLQTAVETLLINVKEKLHNLTSEQLTQLVDSTPFRLLN